MAPAAGKARRHRRRTSYWPHLQSTQVQFAQVQSGLLQLRAASPQLQFTQEHGSHVHAGFSQVLAMLITGSPRWSAHLMTLGNADLNIAARHTAARARALTRSPSVPAPFLRSKLPRQGYPNTPPRFIKYLYGVFASLRDM